MKSLYAVVKNNLMVTKLFFITDSISAAGNKLLVLVRKIGPKPVTVNLEFKSDGLYIVPPDYVYKSAISHCDYVVEERRMTRRKDIIFGLVKALKRAAVWSFIENKDFFKLNENCTFLKKTSKYYKKGLKSDIQDQIESVLVDDTRKKSRKEIKELEKKATQLLKQANG